MTVIVKFLTKGVLVIALEVSEIISDVATHLISPSRIGYRVASHLIYMILKMMTPGHLIALIY